jgi:magnesium transporter
MIKYYYKSLRTQRIQELEEPKRGSWIYVEAPSHKELEWLSEKYNLEIGLLEDALDEDEMPRLEKDGEQSYIFVRFAYKYADGVIATAPLLFIFAGEVLITVTLVPLPVLDRFLSGREDFATTQRAKLLLQALHLIVDQYDNYINSASKQIKLIRARLRGHEIRNQDFIDFVTIEDELNEFLAALQPTNATLRRLMLGRHVPLFEEDQDIIEDLLLNNEQSIEGCSSNIKSIINIRAAYSAISSNNLNRTMKLLTVATVLLAIPNVFFGMFGMNVDLPFQHEAWAYEFVLITTLASLVFGMAWARSRKVL